MGFYSESLDEIIEAFVDGKPIDWERIKESNALTAKEYRLLRALSANPLIGLDPKSIKKDSMSESVFKDRVKGIFEGKESPHQESNEDDNEISGVWGDFKIIRKLGKGGMGVVYEAEQLSLSRKVALKILPSHLRFSPNAIEKFHTEAKAGGRQKHPGFVSVYAVGEHKGIHYIAQELVEDGYTLSDHIDELKKLYSTPLGYYRDVAKKIYQVADALNHAHQSGVIHRDVKPSNILITQDGKLKVTDFGLAKLEDVLSKSRTGDFAGTPYYMSPEQVSGRNKRIDHSTDIYSLGVTLYEILTFERPFQGKTSHEVLKKIVSHEPKDPRKVNPRIPRDLAIICLKAMEKDAKNRYQSMAVFSEDLNRFLHGEVILAQPTGLMRKFFKRIKRNPILSVTLSVAIFSLVGFVLYVLWSYPMLQAEKKRADEALKEATNAKAIAETEWRKSYTFIQFLLYTLSSPRPSVRSKDIKVVDAFDLMLEDLDRGRFDAWPELQANIRSFIGNTYRHIGELDRAEPLLRRAFETLQKIYGIGHIDTNSSMIYLAHLLLKQSRFKEAESLFLKLVKKNQEINGDDHIQTIFAVKHLAYAYYRQGKLLAFDTLLIENNIKLYNIDELEAFISDQASKLPEKQFYNLELDPLIPQAISVIADGLKAADKDANMTKLIEAETKYRNVLKFSKAILGNNHNQTIHCKHKLALFLYHKAEGDEEFDALFKELLEANLEKHGENHPSAFDIKWELGYLLKSKGKLLKAKSFLETVVEEGKGVFQPHNQKLIRAMVALARTLTDLEEHAEAEEIYREALNARKEGLGLNHPETLCSMQQLALFLGKQQKYEQSIPMLEEVLKSRRKILGNEHKNTASTIAHLGCMHMKQNKYSEAESLMQEAVKLRLNLFGKKHKSYLAIKSRLADLYYKQGRISDAKAIYDEVIGLVKENLSDSPIHSLEIYLRYGSFLMEIKGYEKAETTLLPIYDAISKKTGKRSLYRVKILQFLIELYETWGKMEEAKKFEAMLGDYQEAIKKISSKKPDDALENGR